MKYLFERDGKQVTVASPMDDIAALTLEMTAKGFRRVFTVPRTSYQLSYNDAYDEMVEDDRIEDEKRKREGAEAWREVHEIARRG